MSFCFLTQDEIILKKMKLLIYKIKLALHLFIFILRLGANFSNKIKPIIISFFVVGLLVLIGGVSLISKGRKEPKNILISSTPPTNDQLFITKNLTESELKSRIFFLEEVLKLQPQSRDVLLNLSQLHNAIENHEDALNFRNKAINIDPNNPLFE